MHLKVFSSNASYFIPGFTFLIVNVGSQINKENGDREEKFTLINLEGDIKCSSTKLKANQDM